MSKVPGLDDQVLIRLTQEDLRTIKTHGEPDAEFLAALERAKPAGDDVVVACRRECMIDINCVLFGVSQVLSDEAELQAIQRTFEKIEPYEFG